MVKQNYSKRLKCTVSEVTKKDASAWLLKKDVTDEDVSLYKNWLELEDCYPFWLTKTAVEYLPQKIFFETDKRVESVLSCVVGERGNPIPVVSNDAESLKFELKLIKGSYPEEEIRVTLSKFYGEDEEQCKFLTVLDANFVVWE